MLANILLNMIKDLQQLNVSFWLAAEGLVSIPRASAKRTFKTCHITLANSYIRIGKI
jgi:hypothetical protein